jgi:hypothetical protein
MPPDEKVQLLTAGEVAVLARITTWHEVERVTA